MDMLFPLDLVVPAGLPMLPLPATAPLPLVSKGSPIENASSSLSLRRFTRFDPDLCRLDEKGNAPVVGEVGPSFLEMEDDLLFRNCDELAISSRSRVE